MNKDCQGIRAPDFKNDWIFSVDKQAKKLELKFTLGYIKQKLECHCSNQALNQRYRKVCVLKIMYYIVRIFMAEVLYMLIMKDYNPETLMIYKNKIKLD